MGFILISLYRYLKFLKFREDFDKMIGRWSDLPIKDCPDYYQIALRIAYKEYNLEESKSLIEQVKKSDLPKLNFKFGKISYMLEIIFWPLVIVPALLEKEDEDQND